ncbi:fumarylacetoacetate hydrolase family protein [Mycolicibacterium sp. XJ2546]
MRWVTCETERGERTGVVVGDVIHTMPDGIALIDLLPRGRDGLRDAAEQAISQPAETLRIDQVKLKAPIPRPPSIRDCLCFLDHMRNCQEALGRSRALGDTWYRVPAFYFTCPATVAGPYDDIAIAPGSAWQDFELEIAAVIGGPAGRDLSVTQAEESIIGYTILNDWSARDLQLLENQLAIGQGKGKDSAITLGPYLVTYDELDPYRSDGRLDITATALVNDDVVGSGSVAGMDWTFAEVISYASRGVPLTPGDVFGSGTVPGCTLIEHLDMADLAAFRGWLHHGDVVTLRVAGLGETCQRVVSSPAPEPLPPRPNPEADPPSPRVNRAPAKIPFTRGLHGLGDGVWAWTLPDGGYGWSNAGLITGDGESLLVDTLFDLALTQEMLDGMRSITRGAPITHAVITHANGDHTHGNQLLDSTVRVIAAADTASEIDEGMAPEMLALVQSADLGGIANAYARERFKYFDFSGIKLRNADQTFERELAIDLGGRRVDVLNLGPAHTNADSIVFVPDAGVLFAGDLLFIGCTPIVWSGPIANWISACETMIALEPTIVVPGHGPITDVDGIRGVRDYLNYVVEYSDAAHAAGQSVYEAADRIDLGEYADWLDAERVLVNIYQRYRELDPQTPQHTVVELLVLQSEWLDRRARSR